VSLLVQKGNFLFCTVLGVLRKVRIKNLTPQSSLLSREEKKYLSQRVQTLLGLLVSSLQKQYIFLLKTLSQKIALFELIFEAFVAKHVFAKET